MCRIPTLLLFIASGVNSVDAFGGTFRRSSSAGLLPATSAAGGRQRLTQSQLRARGESSDDLLSLLTSDTDGETDQDEDTIKSAIASLESSFRPSNNNSTDNNEGSNDPKRFDPLIGLYEIKSVLTTNKGDNPVGGKWTRKNGLAQKLFRTRTMFQHLLPFNASRSSRDAEEGEEGAVAEAINVISLDALGGSLRVTVILRGDAVPLSAGERLRWNANRTITPLSDLAVRAHFDPPRVFLGRRRRGGDHSYLPLQIGPNTSVVLDTTYNDRSVRVGMGGTSGTRFVFAAAAGDEAEEYEALLSRPSSLNKGALLARLGVAAATGLYVALGRVDPNKLAARAAKASRVVANSKICAAALGLVKRLTPWAMTGMRIMAGVTTVLSGIAMLLIFFSSGGIERDGMSRSPSSPPQ